MGRRIRVAIVGAGPAGSATALYLIRMGVAPEEIVLLDQKIFPREKLCGGIITAYGRECLGELGVDPPGDLLPFYILRTPGGDLPVFETGPSLVVSRRVFDDELLRKALRYGVRGELGEKVEGVEKRGGGFFLTLKGGKRIPASWVVLADGAVGLSARLFPSPPLLRLLEGVYSHPQRERYRGRITFDLRGAFLGTPVYGWVIPLSQGGFFRVGVMEGRGEIPGGLLRRLLQRFVQEEGFEEVDPPRGYPIRPFRPWASLKVRGIYRVGEALGVDPLLGEGIAPSLGMARIVAERIKGELDCKRLPFRPFLMRELGFNLWFREVLARWFYRGKEKHLLKILLSPSLQELALSQTLTYNTLTRGYKVFLLSALRSFGTRVPFEFHDGAYRSR
jgi:flavin-dependent dehydrogenase